MKKHIILSILLCCLCGITFAQNNTHLKVLFTDAKIAELQQRIQDDTQIATAWNEIIKVADKELKHNNIRWGEYLAIAYQVTGNEKYAKKIREILLTQTARKDWYVKEFLSRTPSWHSELGMVQNGFRAAIMYDAIYNFLPQVERKQIASDLARLVVQPTMGDWLIEPTRIHSLNSMGHNWWTACAGLGGVLALSIQHDVPEVGEWIDKLNKAMPQWFSFQGDALQFKPKTFDRNGGMYESFGYADYGIQEALLFRLAWINTHPGKKPPTIPELELIPDFFIQMSYPGNNNIYSTNFGDSRTSRIALNSMTLLHSLGFQDKNIQWYISQITNGTHKEGYTLNTPIGILYQPSVAQAPQGPDLPQSCIFPDFGWASMRNSWKENATMLAVKSGYTWNHSHADANSFVLFHNGYDIVKDAGNCNYGKPEYPAYFFQSQAHNVVMFNGQGQPVEQQYESSPLRGYLHHLLDGGSIKYILADGTGPVSKNFSRNFRHFLWIDQTIYIIDDLKTHTIGSFEWIWHPGGASKKDGMDISITRENAAVLIRPLYPETLTETGYNHDFPEKMRLTALEGPLASNTRENETYYSISYPEEVKRVKAVNAIILKDSPMDNNLPEIKKIEGKNWIGLRIKHQGVITELYINQLADGRLMHLNSCIQANGWETDAYMFAIQYKEGDTPTNYKNLFMSYGSYLRQEKKTYYSSLSKLFFIQKEEGSKVNLIIDGQSIVDAKFHTLTKPSLINLNGERVDAIYSNNMVSISYGFDNTIKK